MFTSVTYANSISLEFSTLSDFTQNYSIKDLQEARLQISAHSTGTFPPCYKSYEVNLPHAPQKESFSVSKNILVEVTKKSIQFPTLNEDLEAIQKKLFKYLGYKTKLGCNVSLSGLVLIKGEVVGGEEFDANFHLVIESPSQVFAKTTPSGSLLNITSETSIGNIELLVSNLFGNNWSRVWNNIDPTISEVVTNY